MSEEKAAEAEGAGNPHARYAAELRKAFAEEVKPEDLRKVARAILERAQAGDTAAARLVLSYTLGKPMEGVDPDRVDELECEQWMNEAVSGEQAQAVIQGMGRRRSAGSCAGPSPSSPRSTARPSPTR